MCVVEVTRVKNLKPLLAYLEDEQGHNGNEIRNSVIANINMSGSETYNQMRMIWEKNGQAKVQALHVIQSFSENELNPNDPNSVLIANKIGQDLATTLYKDFQCKVYTQTDGVGHKVHNHIIVNNVNMFDFTCMENVQYKVQNVRDASDAIVKQNGVNFDAGKERSDITNVAEKNAMASGKYVWKNDLKNRINNVLLSCNFTTYDEYADALESNGVTCKFRRSKTRNYFLYTLSSSVIPAGEKIPKNRRSKSFKLGTDFDLATIDAMITKNASMSLVEPHSEPHSEPYSCDDDLYVSDWALNGFKPEEFSPENIKKKEEVKASEFQHREDAIDAQKRAVERPEPVQKRRRVPTAFEDIYEADLASKHALYGDREL